jgi:hypothetical protein
VLLIASLCSPLQAAQLKPGEKLEYTFSYQGIFSGFVPIEIANASLLVSPESEIIQGSESYRVTLDLSTEAYAKAEMLYPVRYRYQSWMDPELQQPMLVSEFVKTDETSEELLWFDRKNLQGYRYVNADAQQGEAGIPLDLLRQKEALTENGEAGWELKSRQAFSDREIRDYLSLFFRLRFMDLEPDGVFEFDLYNGKRIKQYRVKVTEGHQATFKLNLYEIGRKGSSDEPIASIWMSNDEQRLPLRFYLPQAFGYLQGILRTNHQLPAKQAELSVATSQSLQLVF